MPRPAVFTAETRARLLARIEMGTSLSAAAVASGVSANTAKAWMARGRRETSGPYVDFVSAVADARSAARARPAPMNADELARVVSELARAGSVAAMKLRFEMLRGEVTPTAARPAPTARSKIDELAARRRAGEIA